LMTSKALGKRATTPKYMEVIRALLGAGRLKSVETGKMSDWQYYLS